MRTERLVRTLFAGLCAYEAAAISTGCVPAVSGVCRRHRWVEGILLSFLLLHLHHAATAPLPVTSLS